VVAQAAYVGEEEGEPSPPFLSPELTLPCQLNAKRDAEEAKINEAIRRKGGQDQS
jgi:hypothetical protein